MVIFILLFSLLFYLPIFINSNILVNRGNDLTNFFFPIFYFVKNSILKYHQLPFWNNLFFSGTPLLPDPQAPLFYLPNIIFLIFKGIDAGFVISIFIHIFLAGIAMYLLSLKGFNFSKKVSLFLSICYIASPKLGGYIEAGHFGLIASWAWIPFAFLAAILLARKASLPISILLAISLASIFYTHVLIFIITVIAICLIFVGVTLQKKKPIFKNLLFLVITGVLCFGLIAIAFLPQLSWQSQTTRNLLLNDPDVYPKWLSKMEFIKASVAPIIFGPQFIWNLDTEKTIAVGFFISILSFVGFIKLRMRYKVLVIFIISVVVLLSLNNVSPIYDLLIKQKWYILLRVSTRFWFLLTILSFYLAGLGLERLLLKRKLRFIVIVITFLSVSELLLTSWTKIYKPIVKDTNLVSTDVYKYLASDKDKFRVLCLERCLSQKEASIYGLELADGYGTLQQTNYYVYSQQITQSFYRNRYTLSIPPFEIFEYENLQPYTPNLSAYNIKYVLSNHVLTDKNLQLVKQSGNFLIYLNTVNLPRSNYSIKFYSPNYIEIDTSKFKGNKVILSELYNTDWRAYLNGSNLTQISPTSDQTREVKITDKTKTVTFSYLPQSYIVGFVITLITIIISIKELISWRLRARS